jgi:hypothetical protein
LPEILQEIGAVAGLASVVGLAVLSALYFSQARDVKRLREWAGRAPERAEQGAPVVPGRVVAQPQRSTPARPGVPPVPGQQPAPAAGGRPAPAPEGRPAAATPAAAAAGAASSAAAGTGARPATATQGQPSTPPGPPASTPAATPPGPPAPAPVPASAEEGASDGASDERRSPQPVAAGVAAANSGTEDRAAEDRAAEDGAGDDRDSAQAAVASPPPPSRPGGPSTPAAQRPGAVPPVPSVTRAPSRPGGSGIPPRTPSEPTQIIPPPRAEPWYRTLLASPRYLVLVIAGILVLGGGVAFGVSKLTGGDSGGGGGTGGQQASHKGSTKKDDPSGGGKQRSAGAVKPGNVTVAVLNGTTVPGLAATLGDQVGAAGFRVGTVWNFTDNQLAESVVQYAPGHEREAAAVARKVGISQREPINSSTRDLAGDATVVVIVGADKAP